ncbi:hypothetical protein L284_13740 [Novosphingobium lindaniclasticum LE124]|uniref:Uncharacterized protein n=1 Tax=Novosphingobium lindaniclasticum LE124 TaxID=1096930 RepID=T0HNZ8_9SPHN|nr:hypothetical protein L284_13740 [Novosphingobium lindaniclasticum LE124]
MSAGDIRENFFADLKCCYRISSNHCRGPDLGWLNCSHFANVVARSTNTNSSPIHNDVAGARDNQIEFVRVGCLLDQHLASCKRFKFGSFEQFIDAIASLQKHTISGKNLT